MKRVSLHHYVLIGLLAWGVPAIYYASGSAFAVAMVTAAPVWIASRWRMANKEDTSVWARPGSRAAALLFAVIYLTVDATVGRQKFANNLFLSALALDSTIESINEAVSQGRGLVELLGALFAFIPFALYDVSRGASSRYRKAAAVVGATLLFYEVGISRGYAVVAVAAIVLGAGISMGRLLRAGGIALLVFAIASAYRGDFENLAFSNPLVDGVVFPFINLSLLLESGCGAGTWFDFALEFLKKFVPAFLFPKHIFSFNVEMTRCIYPFFGDYVESVSVFTYMGELFYYRPSLATAAVAGTLLAGLCTMGERLLTRYSLRTTRMFAGLMCVVLLRSRILDVMSFLLFLVIFVSVWRSMLAGLAVPLRRVAAGNA